MPTPAYMFVIGETQENITEKANTPDSIGNTFQKDHSDQFLVQEVHHSVTVPVEPQNGQPSGLRVHGPLVVTKRQDRASPLLLNALVTGEKLPSCELHFFRTNADGKQEHYYTIALTDALLIDMETRMPHCQDESKKQRDTEEILSFSYRAIEMNHIICSKSGRDDWREPNE